MLIPGDSHSWPFDKPLNVFTYATLRTTRMASSTLAQFPSSEFEFDATLATSTETIRTTKDGDQRTGSARLSHSSPALNSSSVPLYVRRDRTDYEGREPQDLGQRDSHTALELCNIIGSV